MKKLKTLLLCMVMCLSFVLLYACNQNEDKKIESVSLNNLNNRYFTDDSIDFSRVNLLVNYDNGSSQGLTKGEFDIDIEDAKEDTQFVLYTEGLYAKATNGTLTAGTYDITCKLAGSNTTIYELMTITVEEAEVPVTITSVEVQGIQNSYKTTDTINFDGISLKVNYSDNTNKVLTKAEFDVDITDVQSDTEFVISTNGLYSQTAGSYTAGAYDLKCQIVGTNATYTLKTISVEEVAPIVVLNATLNNLSNVYYDTDTINFSGITLTVNYSDGSSKTLTKIEIDVEIEDVKSDTEFVLSTDGLYSQTAGNYETGVYELEYQIIGESRIDTHTIVISQKEMPVPVIVSTVNVNNLLNSYYNTDTINFSGITLTVNYSDGSSKTLTKAEFDIDIEDVKEDTEFVILTKGLYSQTAGNYETGVYELEYQIVGESRIDKFTIVISQEPVVIVSSVAVNNLADSYDDNVKINYDEITLTVTYSDDTTETLDKIEFDVDLEDVKADTQCVIYTNNLYSQKDNEEMTAGSYTFSVVVIGYEQSAYTLKNVTINKTPDPITISSVTMNGLNKDTYYVADSVNYNDIAIVVNYSDGTQTYTGSDIEFDVTPETAKTSTKVIISTNGLYSQNSGVITEGEYNLTAKVVGYDETYNLKTISVKNDISMVYDLIQFETPEFYRTYLQTIARVKANIEAGTTTEADYKTVNEMYTVGADNGFNILPEFTLINAVDYEDEDFYTEEDLVALPKLKVNVYKHNDSQFELLKDDQYYIYADGKVNFTDKAIGGVFKIEVKPADFSEDFAGNFINAVTFDVKVEDGYNVTNAKELGLISISDADAVTKINSDLYEFALMGNFYNDLEDYYYGSKDEDVSSQPYWDKFLKENNIDTSKSVNGIFLHGNISVTENDIPNEFKICADEVTNGNTKAVGTVRDFAFLYHRAFTNKDFTFNGNYFNLDFSQIAPGQTFYDGDKMRVYANDETDVQQGHTSAFMFEGLGDKTTTAKVVFKNVNSLGNASGYESVEDAMIFAGSLTFVKTTRLNAQIENVIAKNYLIAWFEESNGVSQKTEINNVKTFDCFNSGIFHIISEGEGTITNSEFKRFGGPAIFVVSNVTEDDEIEKSVFKVDTTSTVESYVQGTEAWFTINKATDVVMGLGGLEQAFNNANISVYKTVSDGKGGTKDCLNILGFGMDKGALGSSEMTHTDLTFNGVKYSTTDINVQIQNIITATGNSMLALLPIVVTDAGFMGYLEPKNGVDATGGFTVKSLATAQAATSVPGTKLYLYYPQGSTVLGILFELNQLG